MSTRTQKKWGTRVRTGDSLIGSNSVDVYMQTTLLFKVMIENSKNWQNIDVNVSLSRWISKILVWDKYWIIFRQIVIYFVESLKETERIKKTVVCSFSQVASLYKSVTSWSWGGSALNKQNNNKQMKRAGRIIAAIKQICSDNRTEFVCCPCSCCLCTDVFFLLSCRIYSSLLPSEIKTTLITCWSHATFLSTLVIYLPTGHLYTSMGGGGRAE